MEPVTLSAIEEQRRGLPPDKLALIPGCIAALAHSTDDEERSTSV